VKTDVEIAGIHVAIVVKTNQGGRWLLPQIAALRARGNRVTVLLPPGPGLLRTALEHIAVPVVESAFDFSFRPRPATAIGLRQLRRQLAELDPDAVFYHLYASTIAARLAAVGTRPARVHMVAGPLYLESPLIRLVERGLARMDHLIICGSRHTASRYGAMGLGGRCTTIPYGVDTDHFRPPTPAERAEARATLGIPTDNFLAIMAAYAYAPKRLVHNGSGIKGHDVLLRAWADFRQQHDDACLLLVGGGFDSAGEAHRAELVRRFGVDDAAAGVRWLDTVPDVRACYAAADLSICPSLSENHGAALESGAMGLPCVVSDAGGLPEAVTGRSGWVVPRGDPGALAAAIEDAYREWRETGLGDRGQRGRTLMVGQFEQQRCATAVALAIEATAARRLPGVHSRPVVIFVEARFSRSAASPRWSAEDIASGESEWRPYQERFGVVAVAARARSVAGGTSGADLEDVQLIPLPYYRGHWQLLRRLPALYLAADRAVRETAVTMVRLPGPVGSLAVLACRIRRRPYAVEVVGDPREVLRSGAGGRTGRFAVGAAGHLLRWQVRNADAVRYVTARVLQQRYPSTPRRPTVGVSNVQIADADLVPAARTGWHEPRSVLAVGSQQQLYKGHDVLLHALARVRSGGVEVTARIVGTGRYHQQLRTLAARLGLGAVVDFVPVADRLQLRALLDGADLFCMPSRTEGLPRALIEAMARALPAVGTAVGGIPELLDAPYLVPPDDPASLAAVMDRLLSDKDDWVRQSERNLDRARTYHQELLRKVYNGWLADVQRTCTMRGRR
jgi:glycosyltransferase involved in cell wall biosynthesis